MILAKIKTNLATARGVNYDHDLGCNLKHTLQS